MTNLDLEGFPAKSVAKRMSTDSYMVECALRDSGWSVKRESQGATFVLTIACPTNVPEKIAGSLHWDGIVASGG